MRTVTIVFAHPEASSFNGALKDLAECVLSDVGCNVVTVDLYDLGFDVALTREEYLVVKKGGTPERALRQQRMVQASDLVVFQFPLWWFSVPGVLKNWLDIVLTMGFGFDLTNMYTDGFLKGKLALLCTSVYSPASEYSPFGRRGDIAMNLYHLVNGLQFCGFSVLKLQVFYDMGSFGKDTSRMLRTWTDRLRHVFEETPLPCVPSDHYVAQSGYQLGTEHTSGSLNELSIGQHANLPLYTRDFTYRDSMFDL